ncbi:helix-turn-helix domain-containing protein, partial [Serratia sp. IR-2025]
MSMTLMAAAMKIKVGNPLRKLVLIKMADNANDKNECYPSYQHIADHCECSKSAVKAHIAALIKMGLITKENRLGEKNGKGNTSNIYYLTLDNPVPSESTAPCVVKKHRGGASKNTGVG